MRHFVAYHNADRMGEDSNPCGLYTSKPIAAVGDIVWIITGAGKTPKRYTLTSWFVINEICPADTDDFRFVLSGIEGGALEPAPMLNGLPWFQDLFKRTAHFSLGLQEIKEPEMVSRLKELAAAANRELTQPHAVTEPTNRETA